MKKNNNIITLRQITAENWERAIQLKVSEEQKNFVASNLYSIAQVQFLPDFKAMGVYVEEELVGFALYGIDPDDGNYWIYRLMIDEKSQGKGYGKAALTEVLKDIKSGNSTSIPLVMIGYEPDNLLAKRLYENAGFVETEIASWGEQLAKLELKSAEDKGEADVVEALNVHMEHYTEMALDLWPESTKDELQESFQQIMTSERDKILFYRLGSEFVSFIHLSIRVDYVEGTESSPTGYIEGIYVKPQHRRKGYSAKLVEVGEQWLKKKGCKQIGSDIHLDNHVSYDFHIGLGFKEASRLIAFIKDIEG
jgi:GNAT superfamily N-acetyltransferase